MKGKLVELGPYMSHSQETEIRTDQYFTSLKNYKSIILVRVMNDCQLSYMHVYKDNVYWGFLKSERGVFMYRVNSLPHG